MQKPNFIRIHPFPRLIFSFDFIQLCLCEKGYSHCSYQMNRTIKFQIKNAETKERNTLLVQWNENNK